MSKVTIHIFQFEIFHGQIDARHKWHHKFHSSIFSMTLVQVPIFFLHWRYVGKDKNYKTDKWFWTPKWGISIFPECSWKMKIHITTTNCCEQNINSTSGMRLIVRPINILDLFWADETQWCINFIKMGQYCLILFQIW